MLNAENVGANGTAWKDRPTGGVVEWWSGGVLDEVSVSDSIVTGMLDELSHHIHLVVTWEEKSAGVKGIVGFAVESHKVLDDVGKAFLGEDFFPQVGGFVPVRVGWVSFTAVVSFVEWEEEGFGSCELGGHVNFLGVNGEVYKTTTELEKWLFRIPVGFVLFDAVHLGGLACPSVFEFECGDGETIDKDHPVDLFTLVLCVVFDLASDAELVLLEILLNALTTAGKWERVEHGEVGVFYFKSFA